MTLLPTIEEIQAEAIRLFDLGLIAWRSINVTIRPEEPISFWCHVPTEKLDSCSSDTIQGLEQAARDLIAKHDPKAKLRNEAAKLGFELVERGGAGE